MTTPLFPAAAAVLGAYMNNCGWLDGPLEKDYRCAAAVLRAAADQVVPESTEPNRSINEQPERDVVFIGAWHIWNAQRKVRSQLLAIATELEAYDDDVSDRLLAIATELEAL